MGSSALPNSSWHRILEILLKVTTLFCLKRGWREKRVGKEGERERGREGRRGGKGEDEGEDEGEVGREGRKTIIVTNVYITF